MRAPVHIRGFQHSPSHIQFLNFQRRIRPGTASNQFVVVYTLADFLSFRHQTGCRLFYYRHMKFTTPCGMLHNTPLRDRNLKNKFWEGHRPSPISPPAVRGTPLSTRRHPLRSHTFFIANDPWCPGPEALKFVRPWSADLIGRTAPTSGRKCVFLSRGSKTYHAVFAWHERETTAISQNYLFGYAKSHYHSRRCTVPVERMLVMMEIKLSIYNLYNLSLLLHCYTFKNQCMHNASYIFFLLISL